MRFDQKITLKNGKEAWLRNGNAADGRIVFEFARHGRALMGESPEYA